MSGEISIYKFPCKGCGAALVFEGNNSSNYPCPYCETVYSSTADDKAVSLDSLTTEELGVLLTTIGKEMLIATQNADMQRVSKLSGRMMEAQMKMNGGSLPGVPGMELPASGGEGNTLYSLTCPHCGATIRERPESSFDEIKCPACGGFVAVNQEKTATGENTRASGSNEDKGARLVELGEQMREAEAAGDTKRYDALQAEYTKLSMSFAATFDYGAHQGIYNQVAADNKEALQEGIDGIEAWEKERDKGKG